MNNTVVVSSDHNYVWGVYLMICSMRKNRMEEPVIAFGFGYTESDKKALESLGNVRVVDGREFSHNLTCSKADAMNLAETDFVSWVDCDSFFTGNCSDKLIWAEDPDRIHIRLRTPAENRDVVKKVPGADQVIPESILSIWRKDVGEREEPRFNTCCSACFLSVNRKYLPFIRRWGEQMMRVLPKGDVGVVDERLFAYFQMDESVLNSLLMFADDAPAVSPYYKLDKDPSALFVHFISRPKPWICWTPHAFRYFDAYTSLVDWAKESGKILPGPVPLALRSDRKTINWFRSRVSVAIRKAKTLKKKIFG